MLIAYLKTSRAYDSNVSRDFISAAYVNNVSQYYIIHFDIYYSTISQNLKLIIVMKHMGDLQSRLHVPLTVSY